jgi:molybdopterin synthase catalytic subunit
MSRVLLKTGTFSPWAVLEAFEQEQFLASNTRIGASAIFVGHMRDFNEGDEVSSMHLEHYPGMTERELEKLIDEAEQRWPLQQCLIVHRVGDITPGEALVLTAVWSSHRKEAFEACRYLIEALKHRAPFWKQETLADQSTRWVESNTPG